MPNLAPTKTDFNEETLEKIKIKQQRELQKMKGDYEKKFAV
jgi:hypothetical protein